MTAKPALKKHALPNAKTHAVMLNVKKHAQIAVLLQKCQTAAWLAAAKKVSKTGN